MKKINILLNGLLLGMAAACTPKEVTEITVSPEVINADYIGNGAEWDPYDEAAIRALHDKQSLPLL